MKNENASFNKDMFEAGINPAETREGDKVLDVKRTLVDCSYPIIAWIQGTDGVYSDTYTLEGHPFIYMVSQRDLVHTAEQIEQFYGTSRQEDIKDTLGETEQSFKDALVEILGMLQNQEPWYSTPTTKLEILVSLSQTAMRSLLDKTGSTYPDPNATGNAAVMYAASVWEYLNEYLEHDKSE